MKNIKLDDNTKNKLKAIYEGFSDEQILEIYAGEKSGVDFTSYADVSLSPEQMKEKREALEDERRKNVAQFECRYFSSDAGDLRGFYNASELLLKYLFNEEIKGVSYRDVDRWAGADGVLQGKLNRIVESLIGDRRIVKPAGDEKILPEKYASVASALRFVKDESRLWFYPGITGKAEIYRTFGKNGLSREKGVNLDGDSAFGIRDVIPGYAESYYSIGIMTADFAFSVSVLPNNTATKSQARVEAVFMDKDAVYADDLSKYVDTALLTAGLKS